VYEHTSCVIPTAKEMSGVGERLHMNRSGYRVLSFEDTKGDAVSTLASCLIYARPLRPDR